MSSPSNTEVPQGEVRGAGSSRLACPRCGDSICRIQRRTLDRLISMIIPVHRYRCRSLGCSWEGSIRASRSRDGRGARYDGQRTVR